MGFHPQEARLLTPFSRACIYNENNYIKLRGRVWCTCRAEDVHIPLIRPLDHEALLEPRVFPRMGQSIAQLSWNTFGLIGERR